jgi:hypothetical protein
MINYIINEVNKVKSVDKFVSRNLVKSIAILVRTNTQFSHEDFELFRSLCNKYNIESDILLSFPSRNILLRDYDFYMAYHFNDEKYKQDDYDYLSKHFELVFGFTSFLRPYDIKNFIKFLKKMKKIDKNLYHITSENEYFPEFIAKCFNFSVFFGETIINLKKQIESKIQNQDEFIDLLMNDIK